MSDPYADLPMVFWDDPDTRAAYIRYDGPAMGGVRIRAREDGAYEVFKLDADGNPTSATPAGLVRIQHDATGVTVMWGKR